MLGRLHQSLWVACLTLAVGSAYGQSMPPSGGYGPSAAQSAGWPVQHAGGFPASGYYGPAPSPPQDPVDPAVITELLPPDRGLWWNTDERLNRALQDTSHGLWFRLEWMSTNIDSPGNTLLGAPLANIPDPRQPFDVLLPGGAITTARVLDTSAVNFDNINGLRGTLGIPLSFGHIEGMVWGTENSTSRINTNELPATNPLQPVEVIATSLLTNGAPGSTVILYDAAFRALYSSDIFSAELNLYYGWRNPRLGLRTLPVAGFRFVDYDEKLVQTGVYNNTSGLNPGGILIDPLVRRIESRVDNDLYSLQAGFRSEFAHQHFTLGVEPKLAVALNHYQATVNTFDLRDSPYDPVVDDGATKSIETQNLVAPYFDLNLYAKIHLTQSIHLRVGWNYTVFSNISRADDNIFYNDNGIGNPPAVTARGEEESLGVSSFTLGGEIILP